MDLLAVIGWPVLDRIRIGPLAISPHGLGIAFGYLAGSWWMLRHGRKRGLSEDHMGTILLWALIGAIFGARFFYVVGHLSEFQSFGEMLRIWEGGISLVGGIVGAIAFAYPFMRKFGYRFLQVMDSAAVGLAFGIIIGRIGDLVIGDHLGKPTDFFLGWAYRGGQLPGPWGQLPTGEWQAGLSGGLIEYLGAEGAELQSSGGEVLLTGAGVHQTALYDFFIAIGLFLFLWWLGRRPRREGVLIMTFAVWYGAGRILTDFLRVDKTWFGMTGSQWTSAAAIVLSLAVLIRYWRKPLVAPAGDEVDPETRDAAESTSIGPALPADAPSASGEGHTTDFTPPSEPGSRA